jgi:hypothetical protein
MIIEKMNTKKCPKCDLIKDISDFNKNKNTKDGLQTYCTVCRKLLYQKNKEQYKKQYSLYYIENRKKILERVKTWGEKNEDKVKHYKKKYVENNRTKINENIVQRKKNEPLLKLKMHFRSKINKILTNKIEKTFELIGCTPNELKEHLEKQFKDGMSWDNHGLFGWHIDHIIPISSAKNDDEMKKLCHFTNLQPLWAKENIQKRNKILENGTEQLLNY